MRQQNWPEFSDTQSQTRGTTGNGTESNEGVGARSLAGENNDLVVVLWRLI